MSADKDFANKGFADNDFTSPSESHRRERATGAAVNALDSPGRRMPHAGLGEPGQTPEAPPAPPPPDVGWLTPIHSATGAEAC